MTVTYDSKAAQKSALDSLSYRVLRPLHDKIRDAYLASDRTCSVSEDLYYRFPYTAGSLKDSHVALLDKSSIPAIRALANDARAVIVARDVIKATPIVKPLSAREQKAAKIALRFGDNNSLKTEMLKEAPRLARDFQDSWTVHIERYVREGYHLIEYKRDEIEANRVRRENWNEIVWRGFADHKGKINEQALFKAAKKYGEETALVWYEKMATKLGSAVDVKVTRDSVTTDIQIEATVPNTRTEILIKQQIVYKRSSKGTPFHQFPARIYVDGQFTTEAEFADRFHPKKDA